MYRYVELNDPIKGLYGLIKKFPSPNRMHLKSLYVQSQVIFKCINEIFYKHGSYHEYRILLVYLSIFVLLL